MTRGLVLLAAALAFAYAADAGAQTKAQKTQAVAKAPAAHSFRFTPISQRASPMPAAKDAASGSPSKAVSNPVPAGVCHRVPQASRRAQAAGLLPFAGRQRGETRSRSAAILRQLRDHRRRRARPFRAPARRPRDTGVRRAAAAKRSPQPVAGGMASGRHLQLRPACMRCIGGKVRHVPPSARLGVHSVKVHTDPEEGPTVVSQHVDAGARQRHCTRSG